MPQTNTFRLKKSNDEETWISNRMERHIANRDNSASFGSTKTEHDYENYTKKGNEVTIKIAIRKNIPIVIAVKPVLPPASTPAELST